MTRIRVLRVIARLNIGGPAIHVVNLTAHLDPARYASVLVTGTENPGEGSMLDYALAHGVEPVVIPEIVGEASFKWRDVVALRKLYRLVREFRPHIVHTHTAKAGFVGRVAARLAGVPVIVHTYHGHVLHGYYSPLKTWLLRKMEWALGHVSDCLIAVSEHVKQDLVQYGVAKAEKIAVVPLGFALQPFLEAHTQRGEFRRELGLEPSTRLVGIVGRIFPIKNHRLFLEAAARVARHDPRVHFVVVGDGVLRPEMERFAAALGLRDRVHFTGWRRDLPRIYADLDVLVVSSNNEGTPVSAIEAMAAGVPVVATRVGGLPDVVQEGVTGYLVPPRDPDALAEATVAVLQDPQRAAQMGEAARAVARERYSLERLVADIDTLYQGLLRAKGVIP